MSITEIEDAKEIINRPTPEMEKVRQYVLHVGSLPSTFNIKNVINKLNEVGTELENAEFELYKCKQNVEVLMQELEERI